MMPSPRIVIVDDERSVRSGLSNLLHSDGYTTACFASGEDLLNHQNALYQADMLIVDVRLSGMSGFELFIALKKSPPVPPVIFISAEQEREVKQQAIALGAVRFLRKPIDVDTLLTLIRSELLKGEARE